MKYFFDTYAIVETLKENPAYALYINENVIITIFNLAEIYWSALNYYGEEKAQEIFLRFRKGVVNLNDETLIEAIKFRKENKAKNLSYTDCIGYIYAKRNGLRFLTGDRQFQNLPNVEFVK